MRVEDYLSEKEQWESIKQWLRENTLWVLAGIAVGGAAVAGWRWYGSHLDQKGIEAGSRYEQIAEAFSKGDRTTALVTLGEMERQDGRSPYLDQA